MPRIATTEYDVEQTRYSESEASNWGQTARQWLKGAALFGAGLLGYSAASRAAW